MRRAMHHLRDKGLVELVGTDEHGDETWRLTETGSAVGDLLFGGASTASGAVVDAE